MMSNFFRRFFNTEFLPMSEVKKIKITLVMFFLLIITAVTIPFSFFFKYDLIVKIIVLAALVIGFVFIALLIRWNKISAAAQVSIIYTIALTVYYTGGTSSFYGYLFFYIALTIIIFYQEIYSYLSFGTLVVALGMYFIYMHQADLMGVEDIPNSFYIYVIVLFTFYLIFLVQILYNEKIYIDLNYDWVKMNHLISRYQDSSLSYLNELDKKSKIQPAYEDVRFQKAVGDVSVFLSEQFRENGKEIINVRDLYLYIHERGLKKILDNEEFSVATKKIANRLDKFLLNGRTDMTSMIFNFYTKFRATAPLKENRYECALDKLTKKRDEQIIALALLYQYLANELSGFDEWDRMDRPLTHQEIAELMMSPEMEEFFSADLIAFFKDNGDLFEKYLVKNS
jgi:hypothetical protein